jgi:hypothetical protein
VSFRDAVALYDFYGFRRDRLAETVRQSVASRRTQA